MKTLKAIAAFNSLALGLAFSHVPLAHANGFFFYTISAKAAGIAGGGAALPKDAEDITQNPALISFLDNQVTLLIGAQNQQQHVNTSGAQLSPFPPNTSELKNQIVNYITGGSAAFTYKLNEQFTVGAALAGGGGKLKYEPSVFSSALNSPSEFKATVALLLPSISWRPCENQSYGFSAMLGYSFVKNDATTLDGALTQDAYKLATAPGIGARIGGMWFLDPHISVSAAVSTPLYFRHFHKYRDVLPHAFNLPALVTLGSTFYASPQTKFILDLEEGFWKNEPATGKDPLEGGFGWKNIYVLRTGIEHNFDKQWTGRIGYSYRSSPIRENEVLANVLTVSNSLIRNLLSLGFTYNPCKRLDLDLGAGYAFKNKITDNGTGLGGLAANGIQLNASTLSAYAGFAWYYQ